VSKIVEGGLNIQFGALGCSVKTQNGETQAIASRDGNLYRLRCKTVIQSESAQVATSNKDGLVLRHQRMGHLNVQSLKALPSLVSGLDLLKLHGHSLPIACEGCIIGKQHRHSFPKDGAIRAPRCWRLCTPMYAAP
jgi:hypothetical protein